MTTGAPEMRPKCADDSAAPMETCPSHQLEHQFRGTVTIGGQSYTATMRVRHDEPEPEQPSGIGDIHCTIPADEPLVKVLPAGGPLRPRRDFPEWECSGCGLRSTTPSLRECLHGHNNCPMVARP